jgi:2,3-bisphosphoglycerate-dependent phosphoglycerate mutase
MRLYLIRHAQSTNNALGDERDRVRDPALTGLGERQAETLAEHLATGVELEPADHFERGYSITRLFCSPMVRSLQTAAPVARRLGLRPEVWTDIHEQGGIYLDAEDGMSRIGYPGVTRAEIQASYPTYLLPEDISEGGWWNRGFEEWEDFQERAARVAEKLFKWAASDERLALITHGGFTDALLKALLQHTSRERPLFYYHYNTAITRLDFGHNGHLGIQYVNRVDHLAPELVS